MVSEAAVTAKHLSVTRGTTKALIDVSFTVDRGTLTGVIGPSGAGKTTLIRTIVGAQIITGGQLVVLGAPAGSKILRSQIGYVTQSPAVYEDLTTRQNVAYFASMLGLPRAEADKVIETVDLRAQANQLVGSLSGGQKARVSLAVALLGEPPLLVLDEPTVGLDPVLREHLWRLFRNLADSGRTLIVSSHVMDEAEQCPQLLLVRDGAILHHGSKKELLAKAKAPNVHEAFLALAGGTK
ncbi:MAG TPA: ABC transporter ATP-binding protein [Candidatus Saccharimonadales bacterium]|nr:ABC transporter ATP-binding protein [Candidatus Saccharimonadales bacterium]